MCRVPGGALAGAVVVVTAVAAAPAIAKEKGYAVATIAIPADGQSAPVAVNVARIAKETFSGDADVTLLDLEKVLEGGAEPLWLDKLSEAEAATKKGKTAKDSVELPVAADAFANAMVAYEQAVPGLKDMNAVVDTLLQQGTVLVLQGDARAGQQAFVRALTLDAAQRLPKDGTNKRVLATFDAAVKEQQKAGQGTLTVYSTTGAAEVFIDGVFRGVSPLTVDIGAGRHYVRVVRDGYVAFGTAAEVRRGSEAPVQASLRPTAKLAKLEEISGRIVREPEADKPIAELAQALQVDRLVTMIVKDENGSALVNAAMVDGVSGKVVARAKKVFAVKDSFFDHDVKGFLDERIKNGSEASQPDVYVPVEPKKGDSAGKVSNGSDPKSMLPGAAEKVETPGAVVGGWTLIGVGGALTLSTIGCGIYSFVLYDQFRNQVPTQLSDQVQPLRNTWLGFSIATDASWILGVAAYAGGTVALINGYAELDAKEEIAK